MASVGGHDLGVRDEEFAAGISWRLNESPRQSHTRTIEEIEVRLAAGSPFVVALSRSYDAETFVAEAYAAVQKTLDLVAVQAFERLTTPDASLNYVRWSRENEMVTLRLTRTVELRAISSVKAEVRDGVTGEIKSSDPIPEPDWHPTFRYFRTSQTAEDVFDSYRNLYLAFEYIASTHALTEGKASIGGSADGVEKPTRLGEGNWLRIALRAIGEEIDLAPYVDDGPGTPESRLFAEQYKACRCALFHAKAERRPLLPGEAEDREVVASASERLARLVVTLMRHYLHLSPASAVLTYGGFAMHMAAGAPHVTLWASDESGPTGRFGVRPDGVSCSCTPRLCQVDDEGAAYAFVGGFALERAAPPFTIRRIGTQIDAGVVLPLPPPAMFDCAVAIEDLDCSGADHLEVVYIRLLNNVQTARTRFTY